jgi:hypothetical protein
MIKDKKLLETLEGEAAPKCAAANGGIPCDNPVAECEVVFSQALWFCLSHWEKRKLTNAAN